MNTKLANKIFFSDIKKTLLNKGYVYFERGLYNLNIIGVRANNNNKITNAYDDILLLEYKNGNNLQHIMYSITTEPGDYYMRQKLGNPKGTAILVPGQYRGCWMIAKHRGKYDALCQCKPVKVYRDGNKDDVYDLNPETIEEGIFGINIHRSNEYTTRETVDMYSAGCQVFNSPREFKNFMYICKKQMLIYGNSFTYTLINEEDLI